MSAITGVCHGTGCRRRARAVLAAPGLDDAIDEVVGREPAIRPRVRATVLDALRVLA
jgi:hypothetical protein